MDPVSAMLLAIALATITVKTGTAGVADVMASRKGNTPPSVQKWNARQQKRTQRGQRPEHDPGPWKRRWRSAAEAHTEKAGQKHAARMEHLHESAGETKQRHKAKLATRAQRREQVGTILAGWGHTSWDATKQAAAHARDAAAERKAEKQAWEENARRDGEHDPHTPAETREPADVDGHDTGQDADVLPLHRPTTTTTTTTTTTATDEPAPSWFYTDPDTSDEHGIYSTHDGEQALYAPRFAGDPEPYWDEGGTGRRYRPGQVGTHHERTTDLPATMPPSLAETENPNPGNDTEGVVTMSAPAHSGEITDLPTAIAYCHSTVQYCDQITGTFEDSQAQASAAVADLSQQLSTLENAQSSLAGQGMTGAIQGQLSSMQERFASLTQQLGQAEQLLAATQEEIAAARADAEGAGKALQSQLGIAEEVQSQQANGVASNTDFYAHA